MHMHKRAVLYLARKKGKAALLFLIFFFISALLLVVSRIFRKLVCRLCFE